MKPDLQNFTERLGRKEPAATQEKDAPKGKGHYQKGMLPSFC